MINKTSEGCIGTVSNGQLVIIADKAGANVVIFSDGGRPLVRPLASGFGRVTLNLAMHDQFLA